MNGKMRELQVPHEAELAREIGSARGEYVEGLEAQKRQLTAEHEKIVCDVEAKVAAEFDEARREAVLLDLDKSDG